ncbi:hypothetical protein F5144DRAFT_39727 [Chaetomium tenue]|uniref:Uncharacterized protein n=1 Tax=Chaetomium tenue TaxID=1854479 RepID=A0ACB7PSH3_9PEZI|nr:hypothetical protein F5144DRAFT_39727 [Chaetomium globosum]
MHAIMQLRGTSSTCHGKRHPPLILPWPASRDTPPRWITGQLGPNTNAFHVPCSGLKQARAGHSTVIGHSVVLLTAAAPRTRDRESLQRFKQARHFDQCMQNAHIGPLPPSAHLLAPSGCGMLCSHLFRTLACPAEPANPRKTGPNAPSGVSLVAKASQVSAGKMLWESRRWGELGGRCGDAKVGEGLLERSGDPHGGQLARDDIRLRALCAHSERSGTLGRLTLRSSEQDVLFGHAHCCVNGTGEAAGVSFSHISMVLLGTDHDPRGAWLVNLLPHRSVPALQFMGGHWAWSVLA